MYASPTSDLIPQTSYLILPASDLLPQTSYLSPPTLFFNNFTMSVYYLFLFFFEISFLIQ